MFPGGDIERVAGGFIELIEHAQYTVDAAVDVPEIEDLAPHIHCQVLPATCLCHEQRNDLVRGVVLAVDVQEKILVSIS